MLSDPRPAGAPKRPTLIRGGASREGFVVGVGGRAKTR
jgi:hypothetical protein